MSIPGHREYAKVLADVRIALAEHVGPESIDAAARSAIHAIVGDANNSIRVDEVMNYGGSIDLRCPRCSGRLNLSSSFILNSISADLDRRHSVPSDWNPS